MNTCVACGRTFARPHRKGPNPIHCSASCRQSAFRKRHDGHRYWLDQLTDDELFEELLARMEADMPAWTARVMRLANRSIIELAARRQFEISNSEEDE